MPTTYVPQSHAEMIQQADLRSPESRELFRQAVEMTRDDLTVGSTNSPKNPGKRLFACTCHGKPCYSEPEVTLQANARKLILELLDRLETAQSAVNALQSELLKEQQRHMTTLDEFKAQIEAEKAAKERDYRAKLTLWAEKTRLACEEAISGVSRLGDKDTFPRPTPFRV